MPDATVEGSIVGHLRLDISDWETKLAEAEQKARELGRISPDIRVSAETAEAIAKLRAVEEAAAAAGGDHISHVTTINSTVGGNGQDFTGATVGATALAEAIRRLDAASAELDVAQAADDEQMRQTSMQALKEAINMEALAAAERKASENAVQLSAAERLAADGANQQAVANGNNVSRMGLIIGAVAALIPMLAPLTGYATGVAGALAGMGAAGVLAILGIKNAMADGTAVGDKYRTGLQLLDGDLDKLERTASSGLLSGFQQAVATINGAMPELNREIGLFSDQLGIVGNHVLNGVVTAFRILNPLFLTAGVYVEQLAGGFQSWTQDGGLQKFATMAMQDFPVVVQALGSLANAIMNIINAFEPLGVASLNLLTVLGNVVSFLTTALGPAFAPVVLGATTALIVFKQWGVIGPILEQIAWKLGAVGLAADAMAGPIGWVIGAVGALAAALTLGVSASQQSSAATSDYTAALQASHGAIDQSIRDTVAKQLADSGALETAKQYHVELSTLTDAVLGNADAQKTVTDAVNKYGTEQRTSNAAAFESGKTTTELTGKARDLLDTVNGNNRSLKEATQSYKDQAAAAKQTAVATETVASASAKAAATETAAFGTANTAVAGYLKALDAYAKSSQTAADKGTFLGASLVAMQGDMLSYDAALAGATNANFQLTKAFAEQGKETVQGVTFFRDTEKAAIDLNTGLIDVSKSGAPALISQLQGMQTAASNAAAATYQHEVATKGAGQAAADAATIFKGDTYDALVKDADQLGLTADQAKKLADRYFGLPSDVITKLQTEGQTSVVQTLDGIGMQLAELTGHPWTSTLDANGVPLSHEAYLAQLRIDAIKQISPTAIAADAKKAGVTVDQFTTQLNNIPDKTVTINADTAAAQAAIDALLAEEHQLNAGAAAAGSSQKQNRTSGAPIPKGANYKAAGGMIEAAYLAAGGPPKPKGTDTVHTMLTPGEFVTKAPSAQAYPDFMRAYNDNPTRALQTVQQSGAHGPTQVTLIIENRTGTNWADFVDFRIEQKSSTKRVQLSTGLQQVAF